MDDKIAYVVWTKGGGIDGRDPSDKPTKKYASWSREDAERHADAWSEIKLEIITDVKARTARAHTRLDPIDALLLFRTATNNPRSK